MKRLANSLLVALCALVSTWPVGAVPPAKPSGASQQPPVSDPGTKAQPGKANPGQDGPQQVPTAYAVYYRTATLRGWLRFGLYETRAAADEVARLMFRDGYETEVREAREAIPRPRMPTPMNRPDNEVVSPERAREAFRDMASQKDIAFQFPADGCYARAHLMTERMQRMGLQPHKAWTFANGEPLYAHTTHHPAGFVTWGYHVAPTLRVRQADGKTADELVIDPSLFDRPVTLVEWKNAQKRRPESHEPYVRVSQVGKPPTMPHHETLHGSGYWPSDDPAEQLTHYSLRVMRVFKRFENRLPPRNLSIAPEGTPVRSRAIGDRSAWLHPHGCYFVAEGKNWVERTNDSHRFLTESARNDDYIELRDDSRKVQVRLYRDRALSGTPDKEGWTLLVPGSWEDPSLLPLEEMPLPDERGRVPGGEKKSFAHLGKSFEVLGPASRKYNSVAWALGVTDAWAWSGPLVDDFDRMAADYGFRRLKSLDYNVDKGAEKIVLYGRKKADNSIEVTHAARQLADGSWSSKLGTLPLVRHMLPEDVNGAIYGVPVAVYVRTRD